MARPKVHDDVVREALLTEAGRVVASDGYAALSVRALADSIGTSTTAIYSLFGGKEGLLGALYARAFEGFGAAQRAVGDSGDPIADLVALGLAYRDWARANPNLFRVMFSGAVPTEAKECTEAAMRTIQPLVETVGRAVARGDLAGDIATIVTALWSAVHGFVTLELTGLLPAPDPSAAARDALCAAVEGWRRPS